MSFWARLILAVVVVLLVAEVAPGAVNWLLLLIIAGLVLSQSSKFSDLITSITAGWGGRKE